MDERARRIGENEALFRAINERIHDVSEGFEDVLPAFDVVCECGDAGCAARITLPVAAYRGVRESPERFVMVAGHEKPSVEVVVERSNGYQVVEKREGGPAELARAEDD